MPIKDVLLVLNTYPDPTPDEAVNCAVSIAAQLDARIAAIACDVQFRMPSSMFGNALLDLSAIASGETRKSAASATHLLEVFNAQSRKLSIAAQTIREKAYSTEVPLTFAEYARFRDLTILPVPETDMLDQWYAETIIFESGRPTLIVPHDWKKRARVKLETAVVAWDFSKTAARAVADSIPLLQKAKRTFVVTVANEKELDTERSAAELARHLSHHNIDVTVETVDAAGRDIGTVLSAFCNDRDADFLVMGAYGHSRLREFVLGGATRSMLSQPPLPILMSH
ncbi:MAG: universal stress protein [Pseudomonadota bacterium]|jgi:nucleotide-binding universal stress UspA family protein